MEAGNAIEFTNLSQGAKSFIWNFYDGDVSYETNAWHYYNNAGTFNVKLTAISANSCRDSVTKQGLISVQDIAMALPQDKVGKVTLFPNPASDFIKLLGNGKNIEKVNIYDLAGKLLISKVYNGFENVTINISAIPVGIYTLKIKTSDKWYTCKLVKQ